MLIEYDKRPCGREDGVLEATVDFYIFLEILGSGGPGRLLSWKGVEIIPKYGLATILEHFGRH